MHTAFYSIHYVHIIVGLNSPTENTLVRNVLEAGKRRLAKCVTKKEPVTISQLKTMVSSLKCDTCLKDSRVATMIRVAFAGFLRSAELLSITSSDIIFHEHYMTIFIQQSKTDIYRDGSWVVIGASDSELCPVMHLKRYLRLAEIPDDSQEYVFRSLSSYKGKYVLRKENKPMTYSRLREIFRANLAPFVDDLSKYGLHSLRSGGATAAANNGIPDRLFKRHGRWKSDKAKDGYIKDSVSARLSVSKALGL